MNFKRRICVMYGFLLLLVLFVVLRLYVVTDTDAAARVLSGQYLRRIDVAERRGFIFDRKGEPLNMCENGEICLVNPKLCKDLKAVSEKIAAVSDRSQSEIYDKLLEGVPVIFKTDDGIAADGVYCYPSYEKKVVCAEHIVGYVNSDGEGVVGAERFFDRVLSGELSGSVVYRYTADAHSIPLEEKGSCVYGTGYSKKSGVFLTIDKDIQLLCSEICEKYDLEGAICITDTRNGEILASVSSPGFDTENVAGYLSSDKGELVNRSIAGFTPGSVFKTVVAAAALEEDEEFYNLEYECMGYYETENGDIIPCHKSDGHGKVGMKQAYAMSCNPYFIHLAFCIGKEKITEMSDKMGMTKDLNIDGVMSVKAKNGDDGQNLTAGYLANLAIGQGRVLVSPLNICTAFSCAVTGNFCSPAVTIGISDGDNTIRDYTAERESYKVLNDETTKKLCEMMQACVEEGLGTDAKTERFTALGKTATAQSGRIKEGKEVLNLWFCGVYPGDDPIYTVCVLSCSTVNDKKAKLIFAEICNSEVINRDM